MIFPLLRQEVRQVLVIDPHDIFLQIFSKRLQKALPHVRLLTAHSAEEALQMMDSSHAFDMIVTEERLSLFHRQQQHGQDNKPITSGSALLQHLQRYHAKLCSNALLVGVSAHWQIDHAKMEQSGADFCWKKVPTPDLSLSVLEELLYCLLEKRGKHELAKSLLHTGTPTVEEAVTPHPGSAKQ